MEGKSIQSHILKRNLYLWGGTAVRTCGTFLLATIFYAGMMGIFSGNVHGEEVSGSQGFVELFLARFDMMQTYSSVILL